MAGYDFRCGWCLVRAMLGGGLHVGFAVRGWGGGRALGRRCFQVGGRRLRRIMGAPQQGHVGVWGVGLGMAVLLLASGFPRSTGLPLRSIIFIRVLRAAGWWNPQYLTLCNPRGRTWRM